MAATAGLVRANGAPATSLDDVTAAAAVSKSQLYHHFDNKADLTRAVIDHTTTEVLDHQQPYLARLDSWDAIAAWFDALVAQQVKRHARGGCPIGSLVPELPETGGHARERLARSCDRWQRHLSEGPTAPRDTRRASRRRRSRPAVRGSHGLATRRLLLTQTHREPRQLRIALDAALAYLRAPRLGPCRG